jgi:mono/diheme cytochrome c family protein
MSISRIACAGLGLAVVAACAVAPTSPERSPLGGYGRAATARELAAWDISVPPTGAGLPAGGATAKQGEAVYVAKCVACHGEKGAGKPADVLVGGIGSLATPNALRTVGSFWPYATTLFDYVRRAMPITNPMSLSDQETYAVTAYLLHLNGIIAENDEMNAKTLPQVKMPNRDGFVDWSRK